MSLMLSQLRDYRLKCYRHLLLKDLTEDFSMQDYHSEHRIAQDIACKLLSSLRTTTSNVGFAPCALSPEEQAEHLLAIFLSLQIGFRNPALFQQATDMAFPILSQLPKGKLLCHLLVHLYLETDDDTLRTAAEDLLADWQPEELTEEDQYLLEFYAPVRYDTPLMPPLRSA